MSVTQGKADITILPNLNFQCQLSRIKAPYYLFSDQIGLVTGWGWDGAGVQVCVRENKIRNFFHCCIFNVKFLKIHPSYSIYNRTEPKIIIFNIALQCSVFFYIG